MSALGDKAVRRGGEKWGGGWSGICPAWGTGNMPAINARGAHYAAYGVDANSANSSRQFKINAVGRALFVEAYCLNLL